jgi:hypothetical protein
VRYPSTEDGGVDGWIHYITKSRSKQYDLSTSVDWLNYHL